MLMKTLKEEFFLIAKQFFDIYGLPNDFFRRITLVVKNKKYK